MGPARLARTLIGLLLLDIRDELPGEPTARAMPVGVARVCFTCGVVVELHAHRPPLKPNCPYDHQTTFRTVKRCDGCQELLIFRSERAVADTLRCQRHGLAHQPTPAFRSRTPIAAAFYQV